MQDRRYLPAASLVLALAAAHCGDNANVVGNSNLESHDAEGGVGARGAGGSPRDGAVGGPDARESMDGSTGVAGDGGPLPADDGDGAGDSGDLAGDGGNPYAELSCQDLQGTYSLAQRDAHGCYPAPYRPVADTCTAVAPTSISCDCQGYVNTNATKQIQAMNQLRSVWASKKCTTAMPTACDCQTLPDPPPPCNEVADYIVPGICL